MKKLCPYVECERWSMFTWQKGRTLLKEKYPEMSVLIKKWQSERNFNVPDYRLRYKQRYICWVEVKWTQTFQNPFSIDWNDHANYLRIGSDTHTPMYLFIFTGSPCNVWPSGWGHIDSYGSYMIKLNEDVQSFKNELERY